MKWIDKLERKFGRYAIKNLMTYIVILNAVVYMFMMIPGVNIIDKLMLDPSLVLKGEIWRLVTYIFIPPSASPIFIVFVLYFYYIIGSNLENEWGSFRFNLYYFLGMIGTTIAAFITKGGATPTYINLSLFLAFAHLYPDFQVMLFFILPIKVKYLAWIDWIVIAYSVIFEPVPYKVAAVVSVINFLIFFGPDVVDGIKLKRQVRQNRKRFFSEIEKSRKD
ncbi:MAG TPA: rhomboid family intramembrane serine protease [Clostridiales bacterium]|nr:rhomboid family intramembrane serine protease [Clostridiales bacterium]